jgi:hypothetical protein
MYVFFFFFFFFFVAYITSLSFFLLYGFVCYSYSPNALGGTITAEMIPKLSCSIVAGAANNQVCSILLGLKYIYIYILNPL